MNVVAEMLLTDPAPVTIWAVLMLLSFPAVLVLGNPAAMRHPRQAAREWVATLRGRAGQHRDLAVEAVEAARFAGELRVAADRAAVGAQRWHQLWEQAGDELTAAWQAWLDADARLRSALAVAAWGTAFRVPTGEEYVSRERYLHSALAAAVERGELPAAAVADAAAGRDGWDARLHPAEQDVVIARASAEWLRGRYEQAVAAERAAWQDAERAHRARGSLRDEAHLAAVRAGELSRFLPAPARIPATARPATVAVPAV
ncbi:hypothetical protein [Actinoplanes sp. URMC 104]|uniref:hypothetical protein n=1 Tax=Actinoplanes sp. URMC 104 TaxID=3423409 RepID=UPI003F1BD2D1